MYAVSTEVASVCARMAESCDKAAIEKAVAKNFPTDTAPHIRHVLKRAKSLVAFAAGEHSQVRFIQ